MAIQSWLKKKRRPPFLKYILREIFRQRLSRGERLKVLDLGCGPGMDSLHFAKEGCQVLGVDMVPEFLSYAKVLVRRAGAKCRGKIRFVLADMRHISPNDIAKSGKPAFDLIWANASLIHLRKKELPQILQTLRRFLKPDGIMACTLFHGRGEGIYHGSYLPGRFFARYLKDELSKYFFEAGWKVRRIQTVANEDRKGRWVNVITEI